MSDNRTDDFVPTPLGQILEEEKQQRMAARWRGASLGGGQRLDPGATLLADMDASRDRQIAQLSQTVHGRKVLAGHGITVTANKTPVPHPNPRRNSTPTEVEQEAEDWLADEGNSDEDSAPGGIYGLDAQHEGAGPSNGAQGDGNSEQNGRSDEPELYDNQFPIVQRGTSQDQANGAAMAARAVQAYNQLLADRKIPQVGPDGVAIQSVTYHNMNIKTPGSYNSTIYGLSQEVGEYGPAMKIDLFLDGTTSFREALHTIAHEVCHGDPALTSGTRGAGSHGDPAIEAVCNAYADKVVKAYFGGID